MQMIMVTGGGGSSSSSTGSTANSLHNSTLRRKHPPHTRVFNPPKWIQPQVCTILQPVLVLQPTCKLEWCVFCNQLLDLVLLYHKEINQAVGKTPPQARKLVADRVKVASRSASRKVASIHLKERPCAGDHTNPLMMARLFPSTSTHTHTSKPNTDRHTRCPLSSSGNTPLPSSPPSPLRITTHPSSPPDAAHAVQAGCRQHCPCC